MSLTPAAIATDRTESCGMHTKHSDIKLVQPRLSPDLAQEWDKIAPHRDELITTGRDLSYRHILLPCMIKLLAGQVDQDGKVLDAGCGTGTFITHLAAREPATQFVGIDPSTVSIEVAESQREKLANCQFYAQPVEDFAKDPSNGASFDAVIANMLLQNVARLDDVLAACSSLLKPAGVFVFAVAHPAFWPRYWQYDDQPWFHYDRELWIEAPFVTSLSSDLHLRSTHVHRPLNAYLNGLAQVGLLVDALHEPMPDDTIKGAYPVTWEFPRFLIGRAQLSRRGTE